MAGFSVYVLVITSLSLKKRHETVAHPMPDIIADVGSAYLLCRWQGCWVRGTGC